MIATATTATGTTLRATRNLGTAATHVVIAHNTPDWDLMAERGLKTADADRDKDMNRFGAPHGRTHIASRHASEKAAQAAARKAAARGVDAEVAALVY